VIKWVEFDKPARYFMGGMLMSWILQLKLVHSPKNYNVWFLKEII